MLTVASEPVIEKTENIASFVIAGLANLAASCETLDESLRDRLRNRASYRIETEKDLLSDFRDYLKRPAKEDVSLIEVAAEFGLTGIELLATCLAIAAEQDLLVGHVLSNLQAPLARSRPTIGLIAQAYAPDDASSAIHVLGQGSAVQCGLVQVVGEDGPLPERQIRIPLPTVLALQGMDSVWPGASRIALDHSAVPLSDSSNRRAAALAKRLCDGGKTGAALIIRCGDAVEARAAAARVCAHCSAGAVLIHTDQLAGMGPWLYANQLIPAFSQWLVPGERKAVSVIPGFNGPLLVLSGPEGEFESSDRSIMEWRLETPAVEERRALWQQAIGDPVLAGRLAAEHRHAAGRIVSLAAKARENAGDAPLSYNHIRSASRSGDSAGLGALAELIPDEIEDDALVVTASLRQEMEALVTRCRMREQFAQALGPSIQARFRPSVRALFVGPSGTGKTLAVGWLATRLGLPLYRVDLSALTSKYIGETEKNLSQLLARAEQNEILLLFDEADALFGKRTDIRDSNDRFANAQTNYLLQRMESYDGITVLTSNGRSRFDEAFSRRFDAILSFPFPGPEERRALWLSHLGTAHDVSLEQLNRLAAVAELSGGQIRNAVLRSAVAAAHDGKRILYRHLVIGVSSEYRKLSRQLPNELREAGVPALT